jgi:acetate kinase
MHLLILNAGSSSLRFQLIETRSWKRHFKGHVDGIGLPTCQLRGDIEKKVSAKNHTEALKIALNALKGVNIAGIGHRVVHGGEKYNAPTLITPKILKALDKLSPLAPLHNPANLQGIRACLKLMPKIPNIAVFDTGFHATLPEYAYLYGLPYELYKKHGIRRYGFHGTSHHYVSDRAIEWLKANKKPWKSIITCHMGNGISLTAIKNGKSIDTSMGFTPLEGPMMGTRAGSFDPAILFHLQHHLKKNTVDIEELVNHGSGLKGLTGISSDVRPLWKIYQNPKHRQYAKVKRAFDVLSYQMAKLIGSYTVALGGLDALIFTAGVGENAWYLRRDIVRHLAPCGIELDDKKNRQTVEGLNGPIQKTSSLPEILVISTNEELQIAKEVTAKLS